MILFTRLTGGAIAINPDLIERAEETPDTVITLVDDKKFLVQEPLQQVIEMIRDYRSYVIARAQSLEVVDVPHPRLQVVPDDTVVSIDSVESDDPRIAAFVDSVAGAFDGDDEDDPETAEGRRRAFLHQIATEQTENNRWTR